MRLGTCCFVILCGILAACVPQSKYEEAIRRTTSADEENARLKTKAAQLQTSVTELEQSLSRNVEEIRAKQEELSKAHSEILALTGKLEVVLDSSRRESNATVTDLIRSLTLLRSKAALGLTRDELRQTLAEVETSASLAATKMTKQKQENVEQALKFYRSAISIWDSSVDNAALAKDVGFSTLSLVSVTPANKLLLIEAGYPVNLDDNQVLLKLALNVLLARGTKYADEFLKSIQP